MIIVIIIKTNSLDNKKIIIMGNEFKNKKITIIIIIFPKTQHIINADLANFVPGKLARPT